MLSIGARRVAVFMVGETTNPPGLLAMLVDDIAAKYDGLDQQLPDNLAGISLEDLYVRHDLCWIALGACRAAVTEEIPNQLRVSYNQEADRLQKMIAALLLEIDRYQAQTLVSAGALVGQLSTTVPDPLPAGYYDIANSPRLQGDAYAYRPCRPGGLTPW